MRNNLPRRREEEDLSQGGLAEAVGVTRQTINAIERERYDPSLELAFKLANHFDHSIEELFDPGFNGDDDDTTSEPTATTG
jgi:putative transcriptional regulator